MDLLQDYTCYSRSYVLPSFTLVCNTGASRTAVTRDVKTKTTLMTYRNEKIHICEEKWYRNSEKYNIMMKARSNTLELGCK